MLTNPSCPKCKTNRRVISSLKRTYYKPSIPKKILVNTIAAASLPFAWATRFFSYITQKMYGVAQRLQTVKPLYQCNSCNKGFQGKQVPGPKIHQSNSFNAEELAIEKHNSNTKPRKEI